MCQEDLRDAFSVEVTVILQGTVDLPPILKEENRFIKLKVHLEVFLILIFLLISNETIFKVTKVSLRGIKFFYYYVLFYNNFELYTHNILDTLEGTATSVTVQTILQEIVVVALAVYLKPGVIVALYAIDLVI